MSNKDVECMVGPRWQITIPKSVREKHGLKPGDKVAIVPTSNGTLFIPRNRKVESIFGMLSQYRLGDNVPLERYEEGIGAMLREKDEETKTPPVAKSA